MLTVDQQSEKKALKNLMEVKKRCITKSILLLSVFDCLQF